MTEQRPQAEFSIRPYERGDQEGVRWLFARTPPWGRTYPRPEPLPEDLEDIPGNYPGGCFVAVEQDIAGEALIGLTAVSVMTDAEKDALPEFMGRLPNMSRIHWVSVAPERWRLGVGRELTQRAVEWAAGRGSPCVVLSTTVQQRGAIALYETMGFVARGTETRDRWTSVYMELEFSGVG